MTRIPLLFQAFADFALCEKLLHLLLLSSHDDDVTFLDDDVGVGVGVEIFCGTNEAHDDAIATFANTRFEDALAEERGVCGDGEVVKHNAGVDAVGVGSCGQTGFQHLLEGCHVGVGTRQDDAVSRIEPVIADCRQGC